jgi:L-amino acid N-acyltransferase YncA
MMGSISPTLNDRLILQVEGIHESEIQNNKITVNVSLKSTEAKCMNLSNLQQKGCPRYRVLWACKIIGYLLVSVKSFKYRGVSRI